MIYLLKCMNHKSKCHKNEFTKGIWVGATMGLVAGILIRTDKGKQLTSTACSKAKNISMDSKEMIMDCLKKAKNCKTEKFDEPKESNANTTESDTTNDNI